MLNCIVIFINGIVECFVNIIFILLESVVFVILGKFSWVFELIEGKLELWLMFLVDVVCLINGIIVIWCYFFFSYLFVVVLIFLGVVCFSLFNLVLK